MGTLRVSAWVQEGIKGEEIRGLRNIKVRKEEGGRRSMKGRKE